MKTFIPEKQEPKTMAAPHAIVQKQSKNNPVFQFTDNRPEAVMQQKTQSIVSNYTPKHTLPIQKVENKTGMPDNLKSGIENLSGYSMDNVKVHYNSNKPAQLNAHAFAQGNNIHIASGQEKHLPHEAWHVVQQKQGRVKPTIQMKVGVNVNDDKGLEKEADILGNKALQLKTKPKTMENTVTPSESNVTQLQRWQFSAKDSWVGIDFENKGILKSHASGTHPVGSIWEDTTNNVTNPSYGSGIPSGSYGDWKKVVRPEEQVDHFPPNAAYKGTKYAGTSESHRPAFPIRNREGHRPKKGEEYGYGGHVSTTNSTFVQKEYTPELNKMMKADDYHGAMRQDIIDKSNVALYQYGDRSAFNELLKPGIQLARNNGWISDYDHLDLLSLLKNFEDRPKG